MNVASDGSPVQLYLRLPERSEEASIVNGLLSPAGTVLDLGCGTGRLAEPLGRLGHQVTGVDNEPAMLAALREASGVRADIGTLDLGGRFDAVLAMSHLVNTADTEFVEALLRTVRRHVREDGLAVIERHRPGWVDTCVDSDHTVNGVRYTLDILDRTNGILTATIRYDFDGVRAEQRFSAREVDDDRLTGLATAAGLRFDSVLNPSGTLVLLRPT